MNTFLVISAVLLALLSLGHTVVGEWLILIPLAKTPGLPAVRGSTGTTRRTLRFAWHLTTVLGIGIAVLLFHYAGFASFSADQHFVLTTLSLTCLASFVVSFVGSKARHPSWIVLLAVAALVWLGAN